MTRNKSLVTAFFMIVLLAATLAGTPRELPVVQAAELTVTNTDDHGPGSLRQAIAAANPGDTITFDLTYPSTITLTSGELHIDRDLTINGPGADLLTVSANQASRVLRVDAPGGALQIEVAVSGLTIRDGAEPPWPEGGAGVWNDETLALTDSILSTNTAGISDGDAGGGIVNLGDLTLTDCTVSGNTADLGGAIFNRGDLTLTGCTVSGNWAHRGGGFWNYGDLTLADCTVSNNEAPYSGGNMENVSGTARLTNSVFEGGNISNSGNLTLANFALRDGCIRNSGTVTATDCSVSGCSRLTNGAGVDNSGTMALANCTISDNTVLCTWLGCRGGGIYNYADLTLTNCTISDNFPDGITNQGGNVALTNSIVASHGNDITFDCRNAGGAVSDGGFNLVEDGTCGFPAGGDPVLGPLQDNGGNTLTRALLPGSPAIDAGDCAGGSVTSDQRGVPRPQDGDGDGNAACDIGAFELQQEPTPTPTPAMTATPAPTDPPIIPEASTFILLGGAAASLAGYIALQLRSRRRR